MTAPPWTRRLFARPGQDIIHHFVVGARDPLDLDAGQVSDFPAWCPYPDLPDCIELGLEESPWTSDWGQWVIRQQWTHAQIEPELAPSIEHAQFAYWVVVRAADADHMMPLQSAWACVRWLVQLGAFCVFDDAALRWLSGRDVRSWDSDRNFRFDREVLRLDWKGAEMEVVSTHGLSKFSRPDLLLSVAPGLDAAPSDAARQLHRDLAMRPALGEHLETETEVDNGFLGGQLLPYREGIIELGFEPTPDSLVLLPKF